MSGKIYSLWLHVARSGGGGGVTDRAWIAEAVVWPITFVKNMLTALKGSQFYFYSKYHKTYKVTNQCLC